MVQVSIVTDNDSFNVDISLDVTVQDLKAIVSADTGIPPNRQALRYGTRVLAAAKQLNFYGIADGDMVYLDVIEDTQLPGSSMAPNLGSNSNAGIPSNFEIDLIRENTLRDPQIMSQVEHANPPLARALRGSPEDFRNHFLEMLQKRNELEHDRVQFERAAEADPFNPEVQKRIEEVIREQGIMDNLNSAMENTPELFGQVHMLYVPVTVNNVELKGFVDTGAQMTIMHPDTAEKCNLMRLVDKRVSGVAHGVGTANIVGRVHSAPIRFGESLVVPASFTIVEQPQQKSFSFDFIIGLDLLRRHKCKVNLDAETLEIQDHSIPFLPSSEVPSMLNDNPVPPASAAASSARPPLAPTSATPAPSAPAPAPPAAPSSTSGPTAPTVSEASIRQLMDLGASRPQALQLLQATNGNIDMAASLLFS